MGNVKKDILHLHKLVSKNISGKAIMAYTRIFWEGCRYSSSDKYEKVHLWCKNELRRKGLAKPELLSFPADGKTSFGGICIPKNWTAKSGVLRIISPYKETIADYSKIPNNLILYSSPTPIGGFTGELVGLEEKDKRGKVVFGSFIGTDVDIIELETSGAMGFVTDKISAGAGGNRAAKNRNAVDWHNFTINPFYNKKIWGFAVTPAQGDKIRKLLSKGKVIVSAKVDVKIEAGKINFPTAVIKGKTNKEILVDAHSFEQGANDNAVSSAILLEVFNRLNRLIKEKKLPVPDKTIRFLLSFETRGMQAYIYKYSEKIRKTVSGITLDLTAEKGKYIFPLCETPGSSPRFAEELFIKVLKTLKKPYENIPYCINDSPSDDPLVNSPMLALVKGSAYSWHTTLDTIDTISQKIASEIAGVIGTYIYMAANTKEIFPLKTFRGYIGFDNLNEKQLNEYKRISGFSPWWISPEWLNLALFYSNGKRTLKEIHQLVAKEIKNNTTYEKLEEIFKFLEKLGYVSIEVK
ncbi:MAG: hypothetical protein A3J83_04545 [Elusimicrobia bacterium RIFOXYA2_FULL_40_6]|nr:MAG: hypothetical protein A3J83_04545 [Elusimicrobia bacterium RIFOXYA2_FULL_40_6]